MFQVGGLFLLWQGVEEHQSRRDVLDSGDDTQDESHQFQFWWNTQLFHPNEESLSNIERSGCARTQQHRVVQLQVFIWQVHSDQSSTSSRIWRNKHIRQVSPVEDCNQLPKQPCQEDIHPRRFLSFDEGGIANKSKYNPVCQYNASKPDKYRIDFFVLANANSGNNFVYHLDVYQGKNQTNAFIA